MRGGARVRGGVRVRGGHARVRGAGVRVRGAGGGRVVYHHGLLLRIYNLQWGAQDNTRYCFVPDGRYLVHELQSVHG